MAPKASSKSAKAGVNGETNIAPSSAAKGGPSSAAKGRKSSSIVAAKGPASCAPAEQSPTGTGWLAKGKPKVKPGAAKPIPKPPEKTLAEQEEEEHLVALTSALLVPPDPWSCHRSAYGGSLSPAECYDRLQTLASEPAVMFDHLTLEKQISALDHPSPSPGIALARAVDAVLALCSPGAAQRVALSGCGLDRVQIGPVLVGSTVELDLSWNPLSEIDSLASHYLRALDASGCRLTRIPRFRHGFNKLVSLNLSFNDLGRLPAAGDVALLSNLRCLGLQNCMLTSLAESGDGAAGCGSALAALRHLRVLDLSFNLLADPAELLLLTHLQRLDVLDVGCNEMCVHPDYFSCIKTVRQRIGTLKTLNEEAVVNMFKGYGEDAAMRQHDGEAVLAGLDCDKSSCSCLEGNPCLSPESCLDWKNRFAVVYKIRLDNYWSKGLNVS